MKIRNQIDEIFVAWIVGVIVGTISVGVSVTCSWWIWIITCLTLGAISKFIIKKIWAKIEKEPSVQEISMRYLDDEGAKIALQKRIEKSQTD